MSEIKFSCIIPAKSKNDPLLRDLVSSIRKQTFPQEKIEILVITEGDAESAKAIGIKCAQGDICAMFCTDNYVVDENMFMNVYNLMTRLQVDGVYTRHYAYLKKDYSLNRYFALMGVNDPLVRYLEKADRFPYTEQDKALMFDVVSFRDEIPTLGENGFFYWKETLLKSDLEHYYHIDNAEDLRRLGHFSFVRLNEPIWHRTADNNLFRFLKRRYFYAKELFLDRSDRRWKIISKKSDYFKLLGFIVKTLTVIEPLTVSISGFLKIRDWAWFWHLPVCIGFLVMYSCLFVRRLFRWKR